MIIKLPRGEQEETLRVDRASHGVKAVTDVINQHRNDVSFVAIDKDLAKTSALRGVVDAVGRAHLNPQRHLKFLSRSDLAKLAKTPTHEGAVVVWSAGKKPMKCANPSCPGHSEPWHLCEDFARRFPMGPLH